MTDDPYLDGMQYAWDCVKSYNANIDVRDVNSVVDGLHEVGVYNLTFVVPQAHREDELFKAGMFDVIFDYREAAQKRKLEKYRMEGYPHWTAINGY